MSKLQKEIWISKDASKELKSLRPVFEKLVSAHQKYIDDGKGDCPYWYGERPHVGLLAAAVWLSKGITLDEYGTTKNKKPNPKRGRCDLWIKKGKTDFECEAKHLWLRLGHVSVEKSLLKIKAKTNDAVNDVKRGLALCFVTPAFRKENFFELKNGHQNLFQSLKDRAKNNALWFDALIWIGFPEEHENLNDAFHYPGLLLVIKEV